MNDQELQSIAEKLKGMNFSQARDIGVEIAKLLMEKGLTYRQAEGVLDYTKDLLKDVRMEKTNC